MGEVDIKKEWPNVRRMQVLGCKVVPATHGQKTLKEAVRVEKQRSLTQSMADRLLCLPSAPSSLPLPLRLSLSLSLSLSHMCVSIVHVLRWTLLSERTWRTPRRCSLLSDPRLALTRSQYTGNPPLLLMSSRFLTGCLWLALAVSTQAIRRCL